MNQLDLINRAGVKRFALSYAQNHRKQQFTRVSKDFLLMLNVRLKNEIMRLVEGHPSVGKTLKP